MNPIERMEDLSDSLRRAVIDLLYRMADDELIMGHRNSEWTGLAPILEEDIAFSSMAQDEMGHALTYYKMLHELGEREPDTLVFTRGPREYRCASLVSLPNNRDFGLCILRHFLYDSAEMVRLTALCESTFVPLRNVARKLRSEEKYHLMHGRGWVLRLGNGTDESHERMQTALADIYPHALGLFEPTDADQALAHAGVCPSEAELCRQWESAISPVLSESNLEQPEAVEPCYGGRFGRHSDSLRTLLSELQLVNSLDPSAKW